MLHVILVAIGGAAGAVSRYLVSDWGVKFFGPSFSYGTLIVNAAGSFFIGIIWGLTSGQDELRAELRALVVIGFLGGFTTFSSYSLDTLSLFRGGEYLKAGFNILSNNVLALGLAALGFILARQFPGK